MRFEVTRNYLHTYIPPRCRKERQETRKETFPVNIRECGAQDAPVAFIVRHYGEFPEIIRAYKGRLYRTNPDYKSYSEGDGYHRKRYTLQEYLGKIADEDRFCYRASEDLDTVIKNTRREMLKYLIVDGEIYTRCGEPCYYTVTFGLGRNHGGTGMFVGYVTRETKLKELYPFTFSAIDRDRAVWGSLYVAWNRGDNESYNHLRQGGNGDITVLMPEMCRFKFPDPYKTRNRPLTEQDIAEINAIGGSLPYPNHVAEYLNPTDVEGLEEQIKAILDEHDKRQ